MSVSEKLRRTHGNLWLALSFFAFALTICVTWFMCLTSWATFFKDGPLILFFSSIIIVLLVQTACDAYIGVSKEEINQSDEAKLQKLNGITSLVGAFIFLALAISDIWAIFVFDMAFLVIIFCFFVIFFIICNRVACKDFLAIEKIVKDIK